MRLVALPDAHDIAFPGRYPTEARHEGDDTTAVSSTPRQTVSLQSWRPTEFSAAAHVLPHDAICMIRGPQCASEIGHMPSPPHRCSPLEWRFGQAALTPPSISSSTIW